jgi:hypothetical protein
MAFPTRRLSLANTPSTNCSESSMLWTVTRVRSFCGVRLDKTVMRALTKDSAWVDGHSALYLRAAALLRELALARADGSLRHFLARLGRIDVLVIDDWAMAPLK